MAPINYDEVEYKKGDLVQFVGYNYTPDYYYEMDSDENPLGIVIAEINTIGPYITKVWMYKVYWFNTKRITETVAGHLRLVYNEYDAT
tara:strand:+ start:1813 stop:2076 length:264 start_codon:yes stop_codon:yes gene_type:complete